MKHAETCSSADDRLRGVIIGLGHQGLKHARTVHAFPGAEVVGAIDPLEQAQTAFQEAFPDLVVSIGSDVVEIDNLPEPPDFAVVAVPHNAYPEIIRALCARRIPFLKEKPFARNLDEAQAFMEIPGIEQCCFTAVERQYSRLQNSMRRFLDTAPVPVDFYYVYTLGRDKANLDWRDSKVQAGGGSLLDMGYHVLARICDWFGPPDAIQSGMAESKQASRSTETENFVLLILKYSNGLNGYMHVAPSSSYKEEIFVVSFPGVYIAGKAKEAVLFTCDDGIPVLQIGSPAEDLASAQLSHFLERVRSHEGFADDQQRHLQIMRVIDRCYQSKGNSLRIAPEHRWRL